MAFTLSLDVLKSMEDERGLDERERANLWGPHLEGCGRLESVLTFSQRLRQGENIAFLLEMAERQSGDSAANLVVPVIAFNAKRGKPHVTDLFVISHEADALRLAAGHVKKSFLYGQSFLGDGVLSTADVDSWRTQRAHLVPGFLPSVLKQQVFPTSLARAQYACFDRIPALINSGGGVVNMSEFLLHEAMAQLHVSLFGEEEAFSDAHNRPLRDGFTTLLQGPLASGRDELISSYRTVRQFSRDVLEHQESNMQRPGGPLAKLLVSCPVEERIRLDATSTCSFAGFDTTANLMQWFVLMMSTHPHYLTRLLVEIDNLFESGDPLSFESVREQPFFNRCIAETLRLWPSVPNGTFRETQADEFIQGRGAAAEQVLLPLGSQIMIPSFLLHRSRRLWGPDANDFNPDRDFSESELMSSFQGTFSQRYCPFTFPPRSCLGMNFAHMESRIILALLLRHYQFELAEPTKTMVASGKFMGENFGTMMPKGGLYCIVSKRARKSNL